MGRSVLLLLALAAAEPRRLLVVDFGRSARTDYGLAAALRHRNLREVFPDVDYLDIEAELGGAELDRVPALLRARVAGAAAVLVKSNWYYVPDEFMRTFAADWGLANVALQVAGSQPPPWLDQGLEALQAGAERSLGVSPDAEFASSAPLGRGLNASVPFYRVLFYETPWYESLALAHPCAVEAFGVDDETMFPAGARTARDIDVLYVGKFADVKGARALLSERYAGLRRVAVGDYEPLEAYAEGPRIVADLRAGGVDVRSPMPHAALADLYRRTRVVVVPSQLQGGGERAVLEARRCGCEVHVFADNSKLAGLLKGPVPGAAEYATRLARGLACAAGDAGACAEACPRFQATAPAAVPRPRRRARGPPVRRGQTGDRVESSPRGRRRRHRGRSRRRAARPGRARRRARPLRGARREARLERAGRPSVVRGDGLRGGRKRATRVPLPPGHGPVAAPRPRARRVGRGPRARDGPMLRGVLTQATTKRVHSKGLVVVVHGVRVVLVPAVVRGLARLVLPGLLDDLAHAPVVLAAVLRVEPRRLAVRGRRRVRVRQ